jgi:uncharacterized membrane protein YphA (DoxX/SURF4 family)
MQCYQKMRRAGTDNITAVIFTVLRVLIGWHFLYEGIIKLASPDWSSYAYLMESKWILSGFFHWIIASPGVLAITDFLNIWGLILIGSGLILGMFTRAASISGFLLLFMYYVANPPFASSDAPSEGHYFIINKDMIEAGILMVFALIRKDYMWGVDRLLRDFMRKRREMKFPGRDNHEMLERVATGRRELIKNLAVLPLFGGVFFGMAKKVGWLSYEEEGLKKADAITSASVLTRKDWNIAELDAKAAMGKIRDVEISRLIPGGNLVAGFAHARDLIYVSTWIKNYFTDEKVIETLWRYEACGINTTIMRTDEQTLRILREYWRRGGRIQWLAQTYPSEDDLSNIQLAIDNGAMGAFVMGNIADKIVYQNQLEFLARPIDFIRSQGLIAGTAAHSVNVPKRCIEYGIEPDFFMKTMHHDRYWSAHPRENRNEYIVNAPDSMDHNQQHDNIWCVDAEETAAFFKTCKIPWIAYKILAAGAIPPEDAFRYVFEQGADFTCVGMFDFQIIDNVNMLNHTLSAELNRQREWFA